MAHSVKEKLTGAGGSACYNCRANHFAGIILDNRRTIMENENRFGSAPNIFGDAVNQVISEKFGINSDGTVNIPTEKLEYPEAGIASINRRPITSEEYMQLPRSSKKGLHNILDLGHLFLIVCLGLFCFIIWTKPELTNYSDLIRYGLCAAFVAIIVISTIVGINKGLSRSSKVAAGKVISCDVRKTSSHPAHYYVSVAFPEQRLRVERISCSYNTFHRTAIGKQVLTDGKKAYAAE